MNKPVTITAKMIVRPLRVLRPISAILELCLIVVTLMRSIPGMGHVLMLMPIIFFIHAVAAPPCNEQSRDVMTPLE